MGDEPGAHFVSEEAVEHILVQRQRALREDRIAELLELLHDLVVQAGIVVINAAQHHDADAVFALQLIERLPRLAADLSFAVVQAP